MGDVLAMHELLAATGSRYQGAAGQHPRRAARWSPSPAHGVDRFTFGPAVAEAFFTDELTAQAVQTFEDAVREISP